jgi:hypothetical protein
MGKLLPDAILDKGIDYIIAQCDEITLCEDQPTTYLEAHTTNMLATAVIGSGDDLSKGDHAPDGRELIVPQVDGIEVLTTGTGDHVALTDTAGSELLAVTTCPANGVTDGQTISLLTWKIFYRDPT